MREGACVNSIRVCMDVCMSSGAPAMLYRHTASLTCSGKQIPMPRSLGSSTKALQCRSSLVCFSLQACQRLCIDDGRTKIAHKLHGTYVAFVPSLSPTVLQP